MFDFHRDRLHYFKTQIENTDRYVIPFIEKYSGPLKKDVLEVGSAEGGVLKAFTDRGCIGIGVELDTFKKTSAEEYLKEDIAAGKIELFNRNIFDESFSEQFKEKFDLIILKDVIEHIHGQDKLLVQLRNYLRPGGLIFLVSHPGECLLAGISKFAKTSSCRCYPGTIYYRCLCINFF